MVSDSTQHSAIPRAAVREDAPSRTDLELSAFAVLGVTLRDRAQRIMELADEQALAEGEEEVAAARAELINPRTRVGAEVRWFPGSAPAKVSALLGGLRTNPGIVLTEMGLNPLSTANLISAALELIDPEIPPEDWAGWLVALAEAEESINADAVLRDINEDRVVAGFPEVRDIALVEAALAERRRHFKDVTLAALERLPSAVLLEALTQTVTTTTGHGEQHAPLLIEEIGAAYELRATDALQLGTEAVLGLVDTVRSRVADGAALDLDITSLEQSVRRWDKLAQPLQLLMKSRGQDHEPSQRLAYAIRSLAVYLVNEHGLIDEGGRITSILADVFAELPEVVERLDEDAETLKSLAEQRRDAEMRGAEWAREITYSAQIGVLFKHTLSISPDGLAWKNQQFPLDNVTRVRWGAVSNSVNGVPTGTTYTIAFGDSHQQAVCETRREEVFREFIPRLMRAVGIRIAVEMLGELHKGETLQFGQAFVDDNGVKVPRHAIFGSKQPVYLRWQESRLWSADGSFYIGSATDSKAYAQLPYLSTDNVHLLEHALRAFFETPKARLSQVFED